MKVPTILISVLLIESLINLCYGNHNQWSFANDLSLERSPIPPTGVHYDQNALFEINAADENANSIKNADKLKSYLKELQRYVALMGKPRYGRDLSRQAEFRKFERKSKRMSKFKILKK